MKKLLSFILCFLMVIGSISGTFAVSAEETTDANLWGGIDDTWFGTLKETPNSGFGFAAYDNSTFADAVAVSKCWHSTFYIKLPSGLKTNTEYELTFNYDNSIQTTASKITRIDIVTEEGLLTANSDGYGTTVFKNLAGATDLDKGGWTEFTADFKTGDTETEYYLYFTLGYCYTFRLGGFDFREIVENAITVENGSADVSYAKKGTVVTITADQSDESKTFNRWEVVSGSVTLDDPYSPTTTFTMPSEAVTVEAVFVENLWGGIDATWFGTLKETPNSGFGFAAYANSTFADAIAVSKCWHSTFYIKLPSGLKTNTEYELTFNYDNSIQTTASKITRIDIVTEEGLLTADSSGYGTTVFKNLAGTTALDKGGWTEFTADFKTGDTETEYYLYFTLGYCYTFRLGGFDFREIVKNSITVENGSADVSYAKKGTEVTVTANEPEAGMVFDHWEVVSGSVELADPYSSTTTFTMGNEAVSVKAVYREYGAKIVYLNTDGTSYADFANLNHAAIETVENADGTCTDTLSYDTMDGINEFLGWYKDDTLLESGLCYTYDPNEVNISDVTAKIVCRNLLSGAAGFEGYSNNASLRVEPIATGVTPYSDRWGLIVGKNYETENIGFYIKTATAKQSTYYIDNGYDPETGESAAEADRTVGKFDVTPHSGDTMLELSASYRSFVRRIEGLEPYTDYTFSMYVLTPDESNFLSSVLISDGYGQEPSKLKTLSKRMIASSSEKIYGFYEEPRMEDFFETNVTIKDKSAVQNWKRISFNFTTDDKTSLYLYLTPRSRSTWYTRCQIFIDDMTIVENHLQNQGNAMRVASADAPQALRYKFAVDNALLTSFGGYTFKNMGVLAADSSKITDDVLTKETEGVKDVLLSESNYQYKEGDADNTYITAALYNIGRTDGKTDYSKYANDYIVRPYIVYEDENKTEHIIYGENVTASVFDVMYAIRDEASSDEDVSAVNNILENNKQILNAYCDWQPDDGWNIVNPNPPSEYDYSFAVLGDLQYTTQYYPDKLPFTFDWLINNKDAKNLQYVINVGDLTNNSTDVEYETISEQLLRLKEAGLDQSFVRGNHDKLADYDKYITAEKFMYGNGEFESYDGTMKTYYQKLTIGGIKYMVMVLDFFPSTAEVEWAKQKIDANPDYNVIINTHGYLDSDMQLLSEDDVYDVEDRVDADGNALGGHAGQYIYDNLVVPCSNVVMVICGHEFSAGPEIKTLTREDGTTAVQMLVDFQQQEYLDLRSYGMIAMLYFSNGGETVTVEWFSAIKNEYYTDKYQFTFDLNVIK